MKKLLKSVFSGRSRGSDSVFGSWSLIDCRFQFLTVYISVYDSSASHVLAVCCKDLSEGRLLAAALRRFSLRFCSLWHGVLRVVEAACWPNNPCGTDGKQIKTRPGAANAHIHLDCITATLRLLLTSLTWVHWYAHCCSAIIFNQLRPNCLYG